MENYIEKNDALIQFWFEYLLWFINEEVGNIKLLLFWFAIFYKLYTYLTLFFISVITDCFLNVNLSRLWYLSVSNIFPNLDTFYVGFYNLGIKWSFKYIESYYYGWIIEPINDNYEYFILVLFGFNEFRSFWEISSGRLFFHFK